MTRRFLSLILTLALMVSMIVLPVNNLEVAAAEMPETCPCGCGTAMKDLNWRLWDPNSGVYVSSGHYYLDGNYAQAEQFGISAGEKFVLDLRGWELTGADYGRLFLNNGYLAVMDTVGGGRMSSKTAGSGFGGVLLMQTAATFELYGGTVTVDGDNKGSRRGGLISVGTNCTFNMYDGMLLGGSSQGTQAEEGGCIAATAANSKIQILGGTIMGGYSPSHGGNIYSKGTTILKNCKVIGGTSDGYGGNIYQTGGSLTVENCQISHGVSKGTAATVIGGGNICAVSSAKVTMKNTKIHNGYAASYGGNVYFGSGSETLENVTITAGVCGQKGGNLRIAANANTTLKNCIADGDVSCSGTLTVAGNTKIGLRSTGLKVEGAAITAKDLAEGAEIYVDAEGLVTDASANAAYFKPAIRTVLTETAEGLTATQAADGEIAGYCPHCNTRVSWTAFATSLLSQDGHYYLTGNLPSFGQKNINANIVLDLRSYDITSSGRVFFIQSGGVSLLDSVGGGVVTAPGADKGHAGLIRNDGGNLQIFGGKYVLAAGKNIYHGGLFYTSGATKIAGGVFDASAYSNESYRGGAIYQVGGAANSLTISAGYFAGGRAQDGGTLHMGHNVTTNITGGHFTDGSASATGGNINVLGTSSYKNGSLNISGIAVTNGQADTSAGNLNITYYAAVKVKDAYIAKGSTNDYGGNILVSTNSTFMEYEGCTVYGGSADRGGNIYSGSLSGRVRLTNCDVLDGTATSNGGNVLANHGYVEFLGGSLTYGTAGGDGGNMYSAVGSSNNSGKENYTKIQKDDEGNVPVILGGKAGSDGGNLYFSGVLHLTDAHIQNGAAKASGADLYMGKGSVQNVFSVGEGVTGDVQIFINSGLLGSPVYGKPVTGGSASGFSANIYLEGDYGMPRLCAKDGQLVVAGAALISGTVSTGYATATDAAAVCGSGEYVKLYTDANLTLTKDCPVDLNGFTANVSGAGTLYGMDTAGSGKVIWAEDAHTAETFHAPDGKNYIAITEGNETTYHLLDMAITGAAIRPSASGIYYTGTWICDDALIAQIDSYGVAVDAYSMPADGFMEGGNTLWTTFDGTTMVSGENKTGAIISGILKEDRTNSLNDAYGKMPVFAAAYVTLKSGTTLVSSGVGYSLHDIMQQLETLVVENPATYGQYIYPAGAFYRTWKDRGMGSWKLDRIAINPLCPWNYNVVEKAVSEGKMHYYFMSGEWHAYSGGNSEPEKWGDSCLVVFPGGETMLIDSGVKQYGPILVENLRRMGITRLDYIVITHPHSDHQNGAFHAGNLTGNGVLDQFEIGQVYHRGGFDPTSTSNFYVTDACTARNIPCDILEMGDTLQIGEVSVQVLWPKVGTSDKEITGTNAAAQNDLSIVMRFDYKEHSSLFTGDLYEYGENNMMEAVGKEIVDVDLLKAPHHGNNYTSAGVDFLSAVSPEIAVATGFENMGSKIVQRYLDSGATLLNDRTYGYIHVSTDGGDMNYETSRKSPLSE